MVSKAALLSASVLFAVGNFLSAGPGRTKHRATWNPRAAASYLDARIESWTHGGGMDHGTFCISCHTGLPFALARASIRADTGEQERSPAERKLFDSIETRVRLWGQVQPYLGDNRAGLSTESVLNAVVLTAEDARTRHLGQTTRDALRIMWQNQRTSGESAGDWAWASFGNEPWEAPDSDYWGATLAAVATGMAPDGYAREPQIQDGLRRLKSYLLKGYESKSLLNRLNLVWASVKLPGLLPTDARAAILSETLSRQLPDGSWTTASLIPTNWRRRDGTPEPTGGDGYATGLVTYILGQAGVPRRSAKMRKALEWLTQNQDGTSGAWPTTSPNAQRDPSSDVGKFMTDAATAYSVLALSQPD